MAETLISPGISIAEIDQSAIAPRPIVAGAAILGPTVKGKIKVPTRVTSYADYQRTFGDVFTYESGSSTVQQEFLTSIAAKNYFEQGGDSLLVVRIAHDEGNAWTSAKSTTVASSGSATTASFELETLSPGALMNNSTDSTWTPWTEGSTGADEYKDGSAVSGSKENIRWEVYNVDKNKGTFGLNIRRGDDNQQSQIILENYPILSLDPSSPNYIKKVIGDQKEFIAIEDGVTFVNVSGTYPNKSKYVRVSSVLDTLNYFDNEGNPKDEFTGSLPVNQRGGFYNGTGLVGMCYSGSDATPVDFTTASALYYENLVTTETQTATVKQFNQSVLASDYANAIDLLENTDEYKINIVSAPGLLDSGMVSRLTSVAQDRGDCIAVVDIASYGTSILNVASAAADQNNSYAATYWPWVQMASATGRFVWCPASTVIPGVYTYTDHQAAPWYAPAGMARGGVQGVIQTSRKLTKADRDNLYNSNVNPIATMPGAGIVVYGQKTLQKKASALDRVNVRRMLIEVKDKIREMAAGLLFEQNTVALRNEFKAKVDPYLASVVQRKGLTAYSIDLSENDNPEVVDRNEFRCGISLQPTRAIEFIYLTFTVTATGVSFD